MHRALIGAWRGARATGGIATLALTFALGACRDSLRVQNEQDVLDNALNNPTAIGPLVSGVAGDFALAYADAVNFTGLFSSELIHTGSFPTWREVESGIGKRPSGTGNQMYNELSRAVWVADNVASRARTLLPDAATRPELAQARIWNGFGELVLADNFCQATIKGSGAMTPAQVYQLAVDHFTEAVTVATAANKPDIKQQALAGRARAKLMLGDYAGAKADAAQIPMGFRFVAQYSLNSTRENNTVATQTTTQVRREAGVHPRYYQDPRYQSDPRTPFLNRGPSATGPDPTRQFVEQLKYPLASTPIPLATWQEARLIEAEADIKLGLLSDAVGLINQVRAAATLAPYAGPVTAQDVTAQLFYERSAELWLQAQRLNDLRRSNDPYMQTRQDKCFEIGQNEWDSNPKLHGGG